jgi:hypothetical protein
LIRSNEVTAAGDAVCTNVDAFAFLGVKNTYKVDVIYPHLLANGASEPGFTHFKRFVLDVSPNAFGLVLTSHSTAVTVQTWGEARRSRQAW